MRIFWITAGVVVVLLASALVAGSLWTGSYIRSDSFRNLLTSVTGRVFDANAGFGPLQWTGASVYSETATLEGNAGSALRQVKADQLRAEVNWRAIFSGAWRVEEISIERLDGVWGTPSQPSPGRTTQELTSPGALSSLLPKRFELGLLRIGKADLAFEDVKVSNSSVSVKPDGSGWIFQGNGGDLHLPKVPPLTISTFRAREQGGDFFLTESLFRLGENGKLEASGESSGGGRLQLSWEGIQTGDLLEKEWKKYLSGTLSGNATLRLPLRAIGSARLQDGLLENVPLLATVAEFTGNPAFRRMPLQEVDGDFDYNGGRLSVSRFSAESKGLMRVEGTFVIGQQGELDGTFEIGVTPQTLQWLPGSRERVFKKARNGYLWTDLKMGGTVRHPTENLSPRLLEAMGGAVIDQGENLIKDPSGTAVKGVKGVLDLLRPLVP